MTSVKELKNAVSQLSPSKLSEFRRWYEKFDAKLWDVEFTNDVKSGKPDTVANEAIKNYRKSFHPEL
jgi:hypothetical protein